MKCLRWKTMAYCAKSDEFRKSDESFIAHLYIPNTAIGYFTICQAFHFAVRST